MATPKKDKNQRWELWKKPYRVVVINKETFEEENAYEVTRLGLFSTLAAGIVGVLILSVLLIFFTPLRKSVPGYQDVAQHPALMKLNEQVTFLEEELEASKLYTDNFRRMIVGEQVVADIPDENLQQEFPDSLLNVGRIAEEEMLRQEIEMDQAMQKRAILARSDLLTRNELPLDKVFLIPPISGVLSAGFDPKIKHFGSDITAPKNTPIKSILDGFVFISDWTLETGHTIGIQHSGNLISFYKHNSALLKKTGDHVKAGEAIAIIGNSGTLSTGPHLHFELWYRGRPVNPEEYVIFQ